MLADDALGISCLNRRLSDRPELGDEHGNEGVTEHVMTKFETILEALDFDVHGGRRTSPRGGTL